MEGIKIIAKNKRASYEYQLLEQIEAGMVLQGTEVKSLRAGKVILADSYVSIQGSAGKKEAFIYNLKIPPYEFGTYDNHAETRTRKLLLNREEIDKCERAIREKGLTIVATSIYFKKSRIKLQLALARGKKLHDKRESMKEKDVKKKLQRKDYE